MLDLLAVLLNLPRRTRVLRALRAAERELKLMPLAPDEHLSVHLTLLKHLFDGVTYRPEKRSRK